MITSAFIYITTLPAAITSLYRIPASEHKLTTKNDLDYLRSTAEDRPQWRRPSAKSEVYSRRQSTMEETISEIRGLQQKTEHSGGDYQRNPRSTAEDRAQWRRLSAKSEVYSRRQSTMEETISEIRGLQQKTEHNGGDYQRPSEVYSRRQSTMGETISEHLRSTAEDRAQWRRLSENIREADEASKSQHWDLNGDIDRDRFSICYKTFSGS